MTEAGQTDFEFDLITVDEDWHKNTGDAIAAQLREAGIKVKRTVLPGPTSGTTGRSIPTRLTNWNMRPLGVQVLAPRLPYRRGLERSRLLQSGLRREAQRGAFHRRRRRSASVVMKDLEQILQDFGILIQPYWRKLYNHSMPAVKNHGMHPTFEHRFRQGLARRGLIRSV